MYWCGCKNSQSVDPRDTPGLKKKRKDTLPIPKGRDLHIDTLGLSERQGRAKSPLSAQVSPNAGMRNTMRDVSPMGTRDVSMVSNNHGSVMSNFATSPMGGLKNDLKFK